MGHLFSKTKFSHADLVGTFEGQLKERYDIVRQIGAGRQGRAYIVRPKTSKTKPDADQAETLFVAKETKEITDYAFSDLLNEFEHMKRLQHPNITKVVELVQAKEMVNEEWRDRLYVISELAAGSDLLQYMTKMIEHGTPIGEGWVAGACLQIMGGVAYLHSHSVVHGDLKPDNFLCIQEFQPQDPLRVPWVTVADFGCAKVNGDREFVCGDPRYQSPETFRVLMATLKEERQKAAALNRCVDFRADVWSLGVTLFELLSGGTIPFLYEAIQLDDVTQDAHRWEKLKKGILEEDLLVEPYLEGSSEEAKTLLRMLLDKDPDKRPTAGEATKDPWFTEHTDCAISASNLAKLEFKKSKGMAHTLLLNALATKLKRDYYQDSWKVFQKFDTDVDGGLSLQEFRKACKELMKKPSSGRLCSKSVSGATDRIDHIFKISDVDNDGVLNFPEFVAVTFDWNSVERSELQRTLKQLFNTLDKDRNGQVNLEELGATFQGALSGEELQEAFARRSMQATRATSQWRSLTPTCSRP
ncbi:unnamed protein product [Effrenium voratum]|nr:unnamed protein product [Effrenium voratum]